VAAAQEKSPAKEPPGNDHHPIHLHGHTFWVTGTEGGRIPESAWIPGNHVLVGVGW
jgi:hypothetical protein